jgi:hypothetical protein
MKRLVPMPPETVSKLKLEKETGPGYQVGSVELRDGRRFDQVIASEGCIITVRGYTEVPVEYHEVATVSVNHKSWNFKTRTDKGRQETKAAEHSGREKFSPEASTFTEAGEFRYGVQQQATTEKCTARATCATENRSSN